MVLVGRLPGRLVFRFLFTSVSLLNIVFKTTVINYFKMFDQKFSLVYIFWSLPSCFGNSS